LEDLMEGLAACFEELEDPRSGNAGLHELIEIMVIALCTVLCGVAPCKRVKLCRLKWRPRQSLASSRVPSLAWRSVTTAAKRRQGGCRSEQQ
jgi:hypothetical protein